MESYQDTGEILVERILAAFEVTPEAAKLKDPFKLFKVPGFHCDDLEPTLGQACAALTVAKRRWASRR